MKKKIYRILLAALPVLLIGQLTASIKSSQEALKNTDFEALNFRFGVIGNSQWVGDDIKYGVYSFNNGEIVPDTLISNFKLWDGFYRNNQYYAICFDNVGSGRQVYYRVYNSDTWEMEKEIPLLDQANQAYLMAFDHETGNIYGLTATNGLYFRNFSQINLETGKAKSIKTLAAATGAVIYIAFDIDKYGNVYTITSSGDLYQINKSTGVETKIGATGLSPKSQVSGAYIDPETNVFYWAVCTSDGKAGLYTVDLSTGAASNVMEFQHNEQVSGLFVLEDKPSSNAPGVVQSLQFTPTETGSLTGKITFRTPMNSIGGTRLSGQLNGEIKIGGKEAIQFSINPNTPYTSEEITFDAAGNRLITVTCSNASGKGASVSKSFWIGFDTPLPVTNLVLSENNGKPHLTWDAPTGGESDGYVDFSQIKYKITRIADTEEVLEENYSGTSYDDESIPSKMNIYKYTVIPSANNLTGNTTTSNEMIFGEPFVVPYDGAFNANSAKLWTAQDFAGNNTKWNFVASSGEYGFSAPPVNANDWLMSPPIKLKAGARYKLSYVLRSYSTVATGWLKVHFGKSQSPSGQTEIADYPSLKTATNVYLNEEAFFVLPEGEDDIYYISFQGLRNPSSSTGGSRVKDVKLEMVSDAGSPGAVENLSLTAGAQGAQSVALTFQAPTKNMGGGNLIEPATSIEIYRNEETTPISTLTPPFTGELSHTDNTPNIGLNTYTIIAVNSMGTGTPLAASVFVGHDVPKKVENLSFTKNGNTATLSWTAPSEGLNNGYVDPNSLTYTLVRNDGTVVALRSGETSFSEEIDPSEQVFISYAVTPSSTGGDGETVSTQVIRFGDAYTLPFAESFADKAFQRKGWKAQDVATLTDSPTNRWLFTSPYSDATPKDDDKGMLVYTTTGVTSRMISPYLDLTTARHPKLSFWMYHYVDAYARSEKIEVEVSVNDNEFVSLSDGTILLDNGTEGWMLHEFLLSDYQDCTNFRFALKGSSTSSGGDDVPIDDIRLTGSLNYDVKVYAITTPEFVFAGTPATVSVQVINNGVETSSDYTVSLLEGEEVLATVDGETISTLQSATIEIPFTPSLNRISGEYAIHALIHYEADEDPENNASETVSVPVVKPALKLPQNLIGWEEDGKVALEWEAVTGANKPVYVADNFDSYDPFILSDIGNWTTVDKDGAQTFYYSEVPIPYTNRGVPMAYQVYNAYTTDARLFGYAAHSGNQSLFCPTSLAILNDDWLISEELCGAEQTVSFFVKSVPLGATSFSQYSVYYSTTTNDTEQFTLLAEAVEALDEWTKVSYTLPDGAKYVAVRSVKVTGAGFMIDDMGYVKTGGNAEVQGYNVYRNGVKINGELVAGVEFMDETPESNSNNYQVTAVYEDGESDYSTVCNVTTSGIQTEKSTYRLSSSDKAIVVEGSDHSTVSVVSTSGILVYQGKGANRHVIPVEKGLYLVTIKDVTTKIIVK